MSMSLWDPWFWNVDRDMQKMQRQIDHLFGHREPTASSVEIRTDVWAPRCDLRETENEWQVHMELPGVNKEEVAIAFHNGVLTVEGHKKSLKEEKGEMYHRTERSFGSFKRSFTLPQVCALPQYVSSTGQKLIRLDQKVDPSMIGADYDNGVLSVHVRKPEIKAPERVQIDIK